MMRDIIEAINESQAMIGFLVPAQHDAQEDTTLDTTLWKDTNRKLYDRIEALERGKKIIMEEFEW